MAAEDTSASVKQDCRATPEALQRLRFSSSKDFGKMGFYLDTL